MYIFQSWEPISEEDPTLLTDGLNHSLSGPASLAMPLSSTPEISDEISLRLSLAPETNGEIPGPSSAVVRPNKVLNLLSSIHLYSKGSHTGGTFS